MPNNVNSCKHRKQLELNKQTQYTCSKFQAVTQSSINESLSMEAM